MASKGGAVCARRIPFRSAAVAGALRVILLMPFEQRLAQQSNLLTRGATTDIPQFAPHRRRPIFSAALLLRCSLLSVKSKK